MVIFVVSQIFHIPLEVRSAEALSLKNHEDIVSILVEETMYEALTRDIQTYAQRIQSVLPQTRAVILTFPRDALPHDIALANARLYHSGLPDHGSVTQKLIGTILIGDIPMPVVHTDSTSFLSIYPYVDFDEPHFVWDTESEYFRMITDQREDERPEIWHSVIFPNTGDDVVDQQQIRDFFKKIYEYDAKEGRYADLGQDPQVLYADSVHDNEATSP